MGIRLAASITMALSLLVMASTTAPTLSAQEPPTSKIDLPRDEIDKIVLDEAKQDKERAIKKLKDIIEDLDHEHNALLYQLINTRVKLKRAVEGLEEIDPSRKANRDGNEDYDHGPGSSSTRHVLRPVPHPTNPRERAEILKRLGDEGKVADEVSSEIKYLMKQVEKQTISER